MFKKTMTVLLLLVFTIITCNCTAITTHRINGVGDFDNKSGAIGSDKKIVAIAHLSGTWIKFSKTHPAAVVGQAVEGEAINAQGEKKNVSIPLAEIAAIKLRVASSSTANHIMQVVLLSAAALVLMSLGAISSM